MCIRDRNFFDNADLFHILLVGVRVVCIHNAGWILQIPFCVELVEQLQIFIVIVRQTLVTVSYTHLDVYKRQPTAANRWECSGAII